VKPNSGEAVQAIVERIYRTPPELVAVLRKAQEDR
jgi:hypothetical protein